MKFSYTSILAIALVLNLPIVSGCSGGGSESVNDADDSVVSPPPPPPSSGSGDSTAWNDSTCQFDDDGSSSGSDTLAVSSFVLAEDSNPNDRIDDGTTIYYPTILESSTCKFNVIGWGNGTTGFGGAHYPEYFQALASHGFVVAVAHTNMAAVDSQPILTSVDLIMAENNDASSIFYQKLDIEFGLIGKSQGAYAVARELSDPNAVAGVLVATGSGEEYALSKPGLFVTGDADFAQPTVAMSYDYATGDAIFAQAEQSPNPEGDISAGHMDLNNRTGVIELSTSFMRCQLRNDANTCDFVVCESCQTESWSEFKSKREGEHSGGGDDDVVRVTLPIEQEFANFGPFTVSADTSDPNHHIFYPNEMNGNHPVITWGNAAGGRVAMYRPLLEHFASWGFVIVASTSSQCRAEMLVAGVELMSTKNKDASSRFYNQLNLNQVGASGHSLGGGCAIGAGNIDPRIQIIGVGNSAPQDSTMTEGALFIMGAENDPIANPAIQRNIYSRSELPTILGTIDGGNHFVYMANGTFFRGYATAWFMSELGNDTYAREAFSGTCEICSHPNWTVQSKD